MNEHAYIRSVTRHLPKDMYKWKINDNYAGGVPDMFIEKPDKDLWIEWKYIKPFPKRDTTLIDLRKSVTGQQERWLKRRYAVRKDSHLIVGCEHGGVVFRGDAWVSPLPRKVFLGLCLTPKEVAKTIINL